MARLDSIVLACAALLAALWLVPVHHGLEGLADYLPLHTFIETVSIVVAALVFGVSWNAYRGERPARSAVLGAGFLAVALLDFGHTLSYAGMPDLVTPAGPEKAIWFWLAARFTAGGTLLSVALLRDGLLRQPAFARVLLAALLVATLLVYTVVLLRGASLPRMFVEGEGLTRGKVAAEYALVALFGAAAALFHREARRAASRQAGLLATAAALSAVSELCFTLYGSVTDAFNLLGHLYKVAAYLFIYRAVFVASVREPFEQLAEGEARLREREAGLRHAQEMAGLAYVVVRPDGSYERWSENWPRLLALEEAALPRSTRESLAYVHPQDREHFRSSVIEAARSRRRTALDYRVQRPGGEVVNVRQTMEPVGGPAAAAPRWLVTLQDVTEQKRFEERIGRLNRVYAVLSGINAAIVRLRTRQELFEEACRVAVEAGGFRMAWIGLVERPAGRVRPVAWAGAEVRRFLDAAPLAILETGPGAQGLAGRAVREARPMVSNDVANDPQRLMKDECAERGVQSLAVLPLALGGEVIGVLALYAGEAGVFVADEMRLLLDLAGDISFALDHIEKEERVRYLAYYDPLTGLANRTLFLERLAQHLAAAGRNESKLGLLILNIERFKTINDTLGRTAGDALLKEFASRLAAAAGRAELVGRVGADLFAVVLLDFAGEAQLIARLERGDAKVKATPFRVAGQELRLSTRAGVALYPQDAADAESLFRNAEAALKRAQTGQKYLFYTEEMTGRIAEKLALENELRQALERNEFVLHYQPKVELATRRVIGMEALIRWASPARGLVAPGEFIPLLEETGLILPVGAWAMAQAVRDNLAWQRAGLPVVRIAVNVSAMQLRQPDFVAMLGQALAPGAAPPAVDLEITESLIMEDVSANINKLRAVQALGVNIAIDDFGTGYSSLGYLARLPVQCLKIDRSFIAGMADDSDKMSLVSTIVSLARSLRLEVIAEGVESELQEAFLRAMGCDQAQGYLYGRPAPADEVARLLRRAGDAQRSST